VIKALPDGVSHSTPDNPFIPVHPDVLGFSHQVFLVYITPEPAIVAAIPVVTYHEVMVLGHNEFSLSSARFIGLMGLV